MISTAIPVSDGTSWKKLVASGGVEQRHWRIECLCRRSRWKIDFGVAVLDGARNGEARARAARGRTGGARTKERKRERRRRADLASERRANEMREQEVNRRRTSLKPSSFFFSRSRKIILLLIFRHDALSLHSIEHASAIRGEPHLRIETSQESSDAPSCCLGGGEKGKEK